MGRKCKDVLPFCPISLSSDVHIDLLNVNTGKIKEADKHFMWKKNKKKKHIRIPLKKRSQAKISFPALRHVTIESGGRHAYKTVFVNIYFQS